MNQYQTRQTLLQRITLEADEKSWEEFVRYYQTFIYMLCRKMNMPHHEADEVVQQVLIKLWKKFPDFNYDSSRSFRAWLCRVVKNTACDYFRKIKSRSKLREKVQNHRIEELDLPEIEELAEREWNDYLSSLALENIRKDFSEMTVDIFLRLAAGEDPQTIEDEYELQPKVIYVYSKRVRDRLKIEYRRLCAELA